MLYVVRHGQTDWNVEHKVQGLTDIPLNENGIAQACELKEKLKSIQFSKVFSSPLLRAKKTAEIICGKEEMVLTDNRLIERCMGDFEGKEPSKFDSKLIWNYAKNSNLGNVEQVTKLLDRVHNFLDEYKEIYVNEDVLVVTHGGIYPAIETYFNGIPEDSQILTRQLTNCEVVKFDYNNKIL